MAHFNHQVILGLGMYFFPVNELSEQKRAMHCVMGNPREFKVRH